MDYTEKEIHKMHRLASETMTKIHKEDKSGKLLYLFCAKLYGISKLRAYDIGRDDKYKFVVITEDEYKKLKGSGNMKYIVDIDALKDCLELTPQCQVNGNPYVSLDIVKEMIDKFPKDEIKDKETAYR